MTYYCKKCNTKMEMKMFPTTSHNYAGYICPKCKFYLFPCFSKVNKLVEDDFIEEVVENELTSSNSSNKTSLRKCAGKYYKYGYHDFDLGYFHQWGCDFDSNADLPGNFSVAIVELPDGTIIMPRADDIKFLKPTGE